MNAQAASLGARIVAAGLFTEVVGSINWIGRILSVAAVYDAPVFVIVALRGIVTALQAAAAVQLWQQTAAGRRLAWPAFVASAVLLSAELGFGLAPSSVPPGLEWPLTAAYACYAVVALAVLRATDRDK